MDAQLRTEQSPCQLIPAMAPRQASSWLLPQRTGDRGAVVGPNRSVAKRRLRVEGCCTGLALGFGGLRIRAVVVVTRASQAFLRRRLLANAAPRLLTPEASRGLRPTQGEQDRNQDPRN